MHSNYGVFVDEVVEEGVDGEAGDALDACLADDVLAVGGHGEDADIEAGSNFLVGESLGDLDEHCSLALCELVVAYSCIAGRCLGADVKHSLQNRLARVANVNHPVKSSQPRLLYILVKQCHHSHVAPVAQFVDIVIESWVDDEDVGFKHVETVSKFVSAIFRAQNLEFGMLQGRFQSLNDDLGWLYD